MNTIKLDDIFQAGMVLQRDRDFVIYGTAAPGSIVRIQIGDSEYEAYSSERGDFACKIGAMQKKSLQAKAVRFARFVLKFFCY